MGQEKGSKITDVLIAALSEYLKYPPQQLSIDIKLSIISTSYSKLLLEAFKYAENEYLKGKT